MPRWRKTMPHCWPSLPSCLGPLSVPAPTRARPPRPGPRSGPSRPSSRNMPKRCKPKPSSSLPLRRPEVWTASKPHWAPPPPPANPAMTAFGPSDGSGDDLCQLCLCFRWPQALDLLGAGGRFDSALRQELLDQPVQRRKIGSADEALDDLAALVDQKARWCQAHIAPVPSQLAGVVDGHLEGQLARCGKVHHVARGVIAHGHGQGVETLRVVLVVGSRERGHFGHTGAAIGGPEIHQRHLAAQIGHRLARAVEQHKGRFGRCMAAHVQVQIGADGHKRCNCHTRCPLLDRHDCTIHTKRQGRIVPHAGARPRRWRRGRIADHRPMNRTWIPGRQRRIPRNGAAPAARPRPWRLVCWRLVSRHRSSVGLRWPSKRIAALHRLPIRYVLAAGCALRYAPMAARRLRHLIGASAPALVSEIVPAKSRGRYVAILEGFWPLGFIAAGVGAYLCLPSIGWRGIFIALAGPGVFVFVVRRFVPESPRWLEDAGRFSEADAVTSGFEQRVLLASGRQMLAPVSTASGHRAPPAPRRVPFAELWQGVYARRTVMLWALWLFALLGYYGLTTWLGALLQQAGYGVAKSVRYTVLISRGGIRGFIFSAWLRKAWGRKPTCVLMLAGSAIAAYCYGQAAASHAPVAQLIIAGLCMQFFLFGMWSVLYAYTPELYPTRSRATGAGFASSVGRVGSLAGP